MPAKGNDPRMKLANLIRFATPLLLLLGGTAVRAEESVSFRRDIAPLLLDNCLACHGPKKAEGSYRVDSFERLMKPGDSGAATFTARSVDESETFRRLIAEDEGERMPLEGDPLKPEQIALFRQWIEQGAEYDAQDPKAPLAAIVPPPTHPDPPQAYPHTLPVTALAFRPDGTQLVAGGYHELTVWHPESGELLQRIKNMGQRTYALAFDPEGKLLAAGGGAPGRLGEVRVFDPSSGELAQVLGTTGDVVLDVAFDPEGKRLATAAADGIIRVFAVPSGEELLTLTSHSDWVTAVAWSDDGKKLASASRDKTAKVFDAEKGELLVTYSGHGQPVRGVAFHPEGNEVYSSGADNKIHRWKIADGKKSADVGFGGEVFKLARGGEFLFATSADKTVRQLDAKSHSQVRSYSGHADWVLTTAYHAGTQRLASGGFDGEIRVWNTQDGSLVQSFLAAPGYAPAEE